MKTEPSRTLRLTTIAFGLCLSACFDTDKTCADLAKRPDCMNPGTGAAGSMGSSGEAGEGAGEAGGATSGATGGGSSGNGGAPDQGGRGGTTGNGGSAGSGQGASGGSSGGAAEGGGAGETATGGEGGSGGSATCDPLASPSTERCLVSEERAVFVNPEGNDAAPGSKAEPVRTIAQGLELARATGKIALACATAGDFEEAIAIGEELDGARFYGGFDCDTWEYSTSLRTNVVAPSTVALRVTDLSDGAIIEDMSFEAADATGLGDSSLAAFVTDSDNVILRRVSLLAGRGAAGADGTGFSTPAATGAPGNNGTPACTIATAPNAGGAAVESSCDGASSGSIGAKGGDGGTNDDSAGSGNAGQPALGGGNPGIGETSGDWSCDVGPGLGGATSGRNGSAGTSGGGAPPLGELTPTGYVPASGEPGENGTPGQGGGGGGAKAPLTCPGLPRTGASGGSGGGGGCGGKGGTGGQGGGASIALASVDSSVTLETVELVAREGGEGGEGGTAQPGGGGGLRGAGAGGGLANSSCAGGDGGRGGNGGFGGGGVGGPSIGIAYVGAEPQQVGTDVTVSASPALGGADGAGVTSGTGAGTLGLTTESV